MSLDDDTFLDEFQRRQVDQMVVTMCSLIQDGDLLAEGIGTFMPNAAYMLAKHTHAAHSTSLCPNGNTLMPGTRPLTLGHDEAMTVANASVWLDYMQINLTVMPTIFLGEKLRWTEFMRPAQLDPWGASNNVCIGSYDQPGVRLPGAAGISDATAAARWIYYYIPRHSRQTLVPTLDFCSGAGCEGRTDHSRPQEITVVSNLCVMQTGSTGRLRVVQLHPGVSRDQVIEHTGFELEWVDHPDLTQAPTTKQLDLLDTLIDPLGLRYLEVLTSEPRTARLRQLARTGASL